MVAATPMHTSSSTVRVFGSRYVVIAKSFTGLGVSMKLKSGPLDYNKSNTINRNNIKLNCDSFLVGKISFPSRGRANLMSCVPDQSLNSSLAATESFPIICIDTMDAGLVDLSNKQRHPQITNPTEDEITLPVIYNELFADLTDEEFAKRLLQTDDYKSICNGAALFHFQCRSTWEDEVITVETSVQIPKVALSFTVIPPLPLFRAIPLTLALLQREKQFQQMILLHTRGIIQTQS